MSCPRTSKRLEEATVPWCSKPTCEPWLAQPDNPSLTRNVLGSPETGARGGGGAGAGCLGLGFEPLTLKGSTAWRARLSGHLVKAFSSHSFTWAARSVWSGRSLSARTASGSHVVVASPQPHFRVQGSGFRV